MGLAKMTRDKVGRACKEPKSSEDQEHMINFRTRLGRALLTLAVFIGLTGCGTATPYFLIESELIQSHRDIGTPDVTETSFFRALRGQVKTLGLQPPDVCADQGQSASGGSGQLHQGILRTRCGVEMAEFERALSRAGYAVVSWGAVQHRSRKEGSSLFEAAGELGIQILLQVNALERIRIQPGRDARFERSFFRATRDGQKADSAKVARSRASEFEALIEKKEATLAHDARVGATINVSAVLVETGTTIWFYEATEVDDYAVDSQVEVLVDCQNSFCVEVPPSVRAASTGAVEGSISGVSISGDPADEAQAVFHDLVRKLAVDLAERLAGRQS